MENKESTKKKISFSNFMKRYQDGPKSLMRGKYICCFLFTIIPIIHFFVFYIGGNYYSFYLAFTQVVDGENVFTLNNFSKVFSMLVNGDSSLVIAIRNTGILFLVHALQLCGNFFIAYVFTKKLKCAKFFRVMLFLPSIISTLALSVVVKNMLSPDGPLNVVWEALFNKSIQPLFYQNSTAYVTLLFYCIWAGFYQYLLIFEGGIRRVPQDVLESARIDGITVTQELFKMIIPIMWDTISTILVLTVCGLFTITAPILLFTDGAYNTQTLNFWFYQQVQYLAEYNVSAAVGIFITLVNLPIVFGFRWLMMKCGESIEY